MGEHEKDQWTRALEAMSDGAEEAAEPDETDEQVPEETADSSSVVPPAIPNPVVAGPPRDSAPSTPSSPSAVRRPSAPVGRPAVRPAAPRQPANPPAPVKPSAPPAPSAPPRPSRPSAPVVAPRPLAPPERTVPPTTPAASAASPAASPRPQRPSRPATPTPVAPGISTPPSQAHPQDDSAHQSVADEAEAIAHVVEDGDLVIAPAPDASVFAARSKVVPKSSGSARDTHRLFLLRTLIPIFLTLGVGLLIIGSIRLFASEDSAFREIGWWFSILLWCMGLFMLGLARVNMRAVARRLTVQ